MTKVLTTMLVGAHFRPPAKFLLASLPSGTALTLVPEPDNPYDASAVRVMLPHSAMLDELADKIEAGLEGTGFGYLDLDWPVQLGYLAAMTNKQLGKQIAEGRQYVGNLEILLALTGKGLSVDGAWPARLAFGPDGSPLVQVEVPEAKALDGAAPVDDRDLGFGG